MLCAEVAAICIDARIETLVAGGVLGRCTFEDGDTARRGFLCSVFGEMYANPTAHVGRIGNYQ